MLLSLHSDHSTSSLSVGVGLNTDASRLGELPMYIQGRTQDLELGGAQVAYPGYKKWGGGGGGGGALQVPYTKSGGGGGGGGGVRFRSDIRKVGGGGGGGAFRFRYLWAHRKYLHVLTYVLPRYTSHARANESKIHAGKGFLSSIC